MNGNGHLLIRKLVRANFVYLEQVDLVDSLRGVEFPLTINLSSKTVNWLISRHRLYHTRLIHRKESKKSDNSL